MWKNKHIFSKILLYIASSSIILILLLSSAFYFWARQIMFKKVDLPIEAVLEQTTSVINNKLSRLDEIAVYFSSSIALNRILKKPSSYDNIINGNEFIDSTKLTSKDLGQYTTVIAKNGQIFLDWTSDGNIMYNKKIIEMRNLLEDKESNLVKNSYYWSVEFNEFDKLNPDKELLSITRVIKDIDLIKGEIALVNISISQKSIRAILNKNKIISESETYIIDNQGKIIINENTEETQNISFSENFLNKLSLHKKGNFLDENKIIFYNKLITGWYTIISIPYNSYMKEINNMLLICFIAIIIAVIIAITIATLISLSISKPIKELVQSMNELETGSFKTKIEIKSQDEIGQLCIHFNNMVAKLNLLIKERINNEKRESELIIASKNAELQMLRAQIKPHFLFNTLNSIKCLAIINKADYVANMIGALGTLLENSIVKGKDFLSIKEEIGILKKYIEIQQMRYGNRLRVHYEVDEAIYIYEIPKFILQPIVENAIIHGISKNNNGGDIYLRGKLENTKVILEVLDNGVGITKEALEKFEKGKNISSGQGLNGIGIENIYERLNIVYGLDYGMSITQSPNGIGTLVTVILPNKVFVDE